jgi:alpha-galactosidase
VRTIWAALVAAALTLSGLAALSVSRATPAAALDNGLAAAPPMGWNDWNAFGCNVSAQLIEQTAQAIVADGMKAAGYQYVNIDDCWAEPNRDADGNLVPNPAKFPDGIKAVADYVHSLGLKLGIYEDSGTATCSKSGGFSGSLGHEDADALQFAQWGVDYLKYDDCNIPADGQNVQSTIQRYETMRDALAAATKATGHPIVFSICEKTDFGVPNSAWPTVGNLWRTTGDIHDTYSSMLANFHSNVQLASLAGPGAWNDPDMLEIGNGGMTNAEYQAEFSLWSEMAAPLIAGTDLRNASPATLALYTNRDVIAVDQDPLGQQGTVVSSTGGHWVLTKTLANGDRAVVLFNETDSPAVISSTVAGVGLTRHAPAYQLDNLWTHHSTETAGAISASVAPHSVVMYRVSPARSPLAAAPDTVLDMSGLAATAQPGPQPVTVSFTNDGRLPAADVRLSLAVPGGWTAKPASRLVFPAVSSGRTVQATWQVTEGSPDQPFGGYQVIAAASFRWGAGARGSSPPVSEPVTEDTTVQPPLRTYASTSSQFGEAGQTLGIQAAGSSVAGSTSQYGAIYLPGAEQDGTVAEVELTSQANTDAGAEAGLMVRNDVTAAASPGFVTLADTPDSGYVLRWDANGDGQLDASASAGSSPASYPAWLKLTRSGTSYTGYYSANGTTWAQVGAASVPSAAAAQDVGVFSSAHSATVGESDFRDLTVGPPSGLISARSVVVLPGQGVPVPATFYNHGASAADGVQVTLAAPDGWTVSPAGPSGLGTVPAGGNAVASWTVTAPAGTADRGYQLTVTATYTIGGNQETARATLGVVVPPADLSGDFDNVGITDDASTGAGNIDGAGSSLSAQALAAAGVTPGSAVSQGGLQFAWPGAPSGQPDNVLANGQSLTLSATGATLGFLATATYGPASGTGTVSYSDGTTQPFTLDVPDWYAAPPSGSDPAITMTYRNRGGNVQQAHQINVYYVSVPLQAGKTVTGLTLPTVSGSVTSGSPAMHIFAIAVG